MKAAILTVGDEILIGQVTDTNATYMAAALNEEGIEIVEHLSVADSRDGIKDGLDRALAHADLVLMTGGLGPTKDDITKQVLAEYFETELVFHQESWERLTRLYQRFGREPGPSHRLQCELPEDATILTNRRGTAPGMWLEQEGKVVVSMPGIPYEMQYLVDHEVVPRIREQRLDAERLRSVTILTAGEGESTIAERIASIEDNLPPHMSLAYLPNLGTVRLRLSARGADESTLQADLDEYRGRVEAVIGDLVYGYGREDLALAVARRLQERGQTLVVAESCSGGSIASMIVGHPGSSQHFLGGVVAYANELKTDLLGVPADTIAAHGAVSQATVSAMAEGARSDLKRIMQ